MVQYLSDLVEDDENYPKMRGAINRVLINVCGCKLPTLLEASRSGRDLLDVMDDWEPGEVPYADWEEEFKEREPVA